MRDGDIEAFSEDDDWGDAQENSDEYVWQYAYDKDSAISQHCDKHDEWSADIAAHRVVKSTY